MAPETEGMEAAGTGEGGVESPGAAWLFSYAPPVPEEGGSGSGKASV